MGWMFQQKDSDQSVQEFFEEKWNYTSSNGRQQRVIDCAVVKLRTAYLAIEQIDSEGNRQVFAMVCMLDYRPHDYYNFGYKDMDETMHPYEFDCPERILNLLTETDKPGAVEWRGECVRRLNRRNQAPALKQGHFLVMDTPLNYGSEKIHTLKITNSKRRIGNHRYRIPSKSRLIDYGYQVVAPENM